MAENSQPIVDEVKIRKAIHAGVPLSITTYTLPHEMEVYMNEVLTCFLREVNQDSLTDYLVYCTNELTTNAKKANTKRMYFREKKLDIKNEKDYKFGMLHFKQDTLEDIDRFLQLQKDAGLYIKVILQMRGNKIRLEVRNNSELTFFEYKRIHDKMMKAQKYTSLQDAFSQILDDSEGAGLGLIIMMLMLQKIGLSAKDYEVVVDKGETIISIAFPLSTDTKQKFEDLSKEIVTLIDELPQFPENIMNINRLLSDPDSKLSEIALCIGNDIALTADLLKLVNSASFGLSTKCQNISDAVKMVGLRGVRNLMYSLGTMKILGENTPEKKALWSHSYQVAFYAYNLSRNFCASEKNIINDSYVCGLMHDIGKIIFSDAHPTVMKKFSEKCAEKNIPNQFLEKLIGGVDHEEIGMQIAQKWNFPEIISNTINFHHHPEDAPQESRRLAYLISLSDMIAHFQEGSYEYYQFDKKMLEEFHIKNEEQLKSISEKLQNAFAEEQHTAGK